MVSLLDQQNAQFNNIKGRNFRSGKHCVINKYVIKMIMRHCSSEDADRITIILHATCSNIGAELNIQKDGKKIRICSSLTGLQLKSR